MREPTLLIVIKANVSSRVHRRIRMDYVGIKLYTPDGRLEGELRVVGLFTSGAYTRSVRQIPYVRHKVTRVLQRAGFDPNSHSGKALMHILEEYPRDELFQVDVDTLYNFVIEILILYERPRVRALARVDKFDRFVSTLVFIPREKFDTAVRMRVAEFLAHIYNGRLAASYVFFPEGSLARVHYIIGRYEGKTPVVERATLEAAISAIAATWADKLKAALTIPTDGMRARMLTNRYAQAFTGAPGIGIAFVAVNRNRHGAGRREFFDGGDISDRLLRAEDLSIAALSKICQTHRAGVNGVLECRTGLRSISWAR